MRISKYIQIDFADSRIEGIDAIQDIRRAAEYACLNLLSRHNIVLEMPMVTPEDKVVAEVRLPEGLPEDFPIGRHLRGLSTFLLKRCGGRYNDFVTGKRLLTYTEIPKPTGDEERHFSMADRLEAVAEFARLLERNDAESLSRISLIMDILNEAKEI